MKSMKRECTREPSRLSAAALEFRRSFDFSTRIGQSKHLHSLQNHAAFWSTASIAVLTGTSKGTNDNHNGQGSEKETSAAVVRSPQGLDGLELAVRTPQKNGKQLPYSKTRVRFYKIASLTTYAKLQPSRLSAAATLIMQEPFGRAASRLAGTLALQ